MLIVGPIDIEPIDWEEDETAGADETATPTPAARRSLVEEDGATSVPSSSEAARAPVMCSRPMRRPGSGVLWGVRLLVLALAISSSAQEATPARPWAESVSEAAQAEALATFAEGNEFFVRLQYSQALERYRSAIEKWDHPAIRFNMAVSFINLDLPLEARESHERALVYGPAPFETADLYQQALTYRKLLDGRLAVLVISCHEPGARVSLDGKEVLRAPAETQHVVLPGEHQIVASKNGFLTTTRQVMLTGGNEELLKIKWVARVGAECSKGRSLQSVPRLNGSRRHDA